MDFYYNEDDLREDNDTNDYENDNTDVRQGGYPPSLPPKTIPKQGGNFKENFKFNWSDKNKLCKNLCDCFGRHTYLWLNNGQSFWIWLVSIHDQYIICYRWDGRRWVSAQIAKNRIVKLV